MLILHEIFRVAFLRKNDILKWVNDNQSKSFICRELKCKPITLDLYLIKFAKFLN